jgi:TolB-like protein/Tfp pilus assembly protein PilF
MGEASPNSTVTTPSGAVFLSYASQDAEAAQRISDALRAAGIEVWFDQSELRGGDAWDRKIRDQIRHCALFIPVISAHSQARLEGYFRREWKFAVERKRDIADELAFLLPVVIDETPERGASVPEGFHEVQWTRLPGGAASQEFIQHVSRLLTGHPDRPTPAVQTLKPSLPPAPARPASESKSGSPLRMWLLLIAVATAVIVGYIGIDRYLLHKGTQLSAASATAANADKSIAVLPFADMSEKHDQEYFSDGLAEELLDLLAKTPGLRVTARTSSFYFKGKQATIPEIARTLGVANILEGSVRKSGKHLRITTQLIRADNAEHLWSETYDRDQEDIFTIQDDIARAVVDNLRMTLLGGGVPRSGSAVMNPQAHNLYLQGRYLIASDTAEDLTKAGGYFRRALDLEPKYAPAWAGLALVASRQVANGYGPVADSIAQTASAAQKSVECDPSYAEGYVELGWSRIFSNFDWTGAREAFDYALRLEPSNSGALFALAHVIMTVGDVDDSLRRYRQGLERDPLNLLQRRYMARVLLYAERLDEAEEVIRQVLEANPSFPAAHYELGRILLARGQVPQAVREFESEKSSWRVSGVPLGYHAQGRTADASAALQRQVEDSAGAEYQVAEAYAYFGNVDQAFAWLDRAVEFRDPGIQWLRGDPQLRNLTRDPRYVALLRRLNLSL